MLVLPIEWTTLQGLDYPCAPGLMRLQSIWMLPDARCGTVPICSFVWFDNDDL